MAQVIVPKNYIYNQSTIAAGKSISNIFTSPVTLSYSGTYMYADGVLCSDISINYNLGSSTSSANGGGQRITIYNDSDLVGRCLIVDITNLPKFQNTSTSLTRNVTLIFNHNGTSIQLKRLSIAASTTSVNTYGATNSLNGKYYVNLLTNTVTQNADTSECCKAVVPKNWIYPTAASATIAYNRVFHIVSLSSTMVSNMSIPKYLGYGFNLRWDLAPVDDLGRYDISRIPECTDVTITINISADSCRFVKLTLANSPAMKNTSKFPRICEANVVFGNGGSTLNLQKRTVAAGSSIDPTLTLAGWADGEYWIDLKTKQLVDPIKAITTF